MLADLLLQVPSVREFLNTLLADLSGRRSLLVLLPEGVEAGDLWNSIGHLIRHKFHTEEIMLPDLETNVLPAAALGRALNVEWPEDSSPRSIENLMISEDLPEILYLQGFNELSEPTQKTWLAFLSRWAQVSQSLSSPPALILFTPGYLLPVKVPEDNVRLSIHYWWGFPSALEIQLLYRLRNAGDEQSPRHRWSEHLISAIAGNDVTLAEYLWDHPNIYPDRLPSLLQEFGTHQRGWTRQDLQEWGADDFLVTPIHDEGRPSSSPPLSWCQLWAHGALNWTPEYGLELHTSALALLNHTEDLQHRLWRGQTSLLFPLIDNVRLSICRHLSSRYGKGWPVRWQEPDNNLDKAAVETNPLACQWSHLAMLFNSNSGVPLGREQRELISVVRQARQIRNKLAHYQLIALYDFEKLWAEIGRIQSKIRVVVPA